MRWFRIRRRPPSSFPASEAGAVAVEFIILFPLFLLIVVGIVEFGHLWYVDHVITNASREGARAGVVLPPSNITISRQSWAQTAAYNAVTAYLNPNGQNIIPGVTITKPKSSSDITAGSNSGNNLTVQIQATKVALVLGKVVPAFETMTLQATTTMRME